MKRVIGIVSGKGGVGKTVVTTNLGLALTDLVKYVTVIDADMSASNLGIQLGTYEPTLGLQEVLNGEIDIDDSINFHSSGLRFVPSSISSERRFLFKPYRLKNVLKNMDGIILIDSPPGLGDDVFSVVNACNEILVVTNPEIPAITDAIKIIKFSRDMNKNVLGVVVNRRKYRYELNDENIEKLCEVPVISTIPEDGHLRKSIHEKMPVVKYKPLANSSIEFRRLASSLIGLDYKKPKLLKIRRLF